VVQAVIWGLARRGGSQLCHQDQSRRVPQSPGPSPAGHTESAAVAMAGRPVGWSHSAGSEALWGSLQRAHERTRFHLPFMRKGHDKSGLFLCPGDPMWSAGGWGERGFGGPQLYAEAGRNSGQCSLLRNERDLGRRKLERRSPPSCVPCLQ
jgi:hypothetical protein